MSGHPWALKRSLTQEIDGFAPACSPVQLPWLGSRLMYVFVLLGYGPVVFGGLR